VDDAAFHQLLSALREAPAAIEEQVRSVPAHRWVDVVLDGEVTWTRRELLAHIAANDLRQLTRVRVGAGIGTQRDVEALEEQGDVDRWNQAQVAARSGSSVEELLAEMQMHRRALIALLEQLTPEQRSREMPFRATRLPLEEMVPIMLDHLAQHARELAST
jgi:hypothetical protein